MNRLSSILAIVLQMGALGCSKDTTSPMNPTQQSNFQVRPADGETGVRLDTRVEMTFAKPVDRVIVERNFHLISRRSMADSLCPVDTAMRHSEMGSAMMDSMTMNHLMQWYSAAGRFFWNMSSTESTFTPDSMLTPNMQYMVHLGGEMMQMMRSRMGEMGMMTGHGAVTGVDAMAFHFTTLDTSGTGGHGGHH